MIKERCSLIPFLFLDKLINRNKTSNAKPTIRGFENNFEVYVVLLWSKDAGLKKHLGSSCRVQLGQYLLSCMLDMWTDVVAHRLIFLLETSIKMEMFVDFPFRNSNENKHINKLLKRQPAN